MSSSCLPASVFLHQLHTGWLVSHSTVYVTTSSLLQLCLGSSCWMLKTIESLQWPHRSRRTRHYTWTRVRNCFVASPYLDCLVHAAQRVLHCMPCMLDPVMLVSAAGAGARASWRQCCFPRAIVQLVARQHCSCTNSHRMHECICRCTIARVVLTTMHFDGPCSWLPHACIHHHACLQQAW
jgi:hypothetical protein